MNLRLLLSVPALIACAAGADSPDTQRAPVDAVAAASMVAAKPYTGISTQAPQASPRAGPPPQATPAPQRASTPPPAPVCIPRCGDRICGVDPVCSESCGSCRAGLRCSEGTCIAAERLRENGDTCSSDLECASVFCEQSMAGELHCYGDQGPNDPCGDVFDCRGGACVPMTPGGAGVCSDGVVACMDLNLSSVCDDFALAFCQIRVLDCPSTVPDFNDCYVRACVSLSQSRIDGGCDRGLANLRAGVSPCE